MGIDSRGVLRGQCSIQNCDCEEYKLSLVENSGQQNEACAYCGDPPAKHSATASSLTRPQAHADRNRQHDDGEDFTADRLPWEKRVLGWIPNPQRPSGLFYNKILPQFYRSYWPICPHAKNFRAGFIAERTRQWIIHERVERCKQQLTYLRRDNPACAGRFLSSTSYCPKPSDAEALNTLQSEIMKIKCKISSILDDLSAHNISLFNKSGTIKSGRGCAVSFNEEYTTLTLALQEDLVSLEETLAAKKETAYDVWRNRYNKLGKRKGKKMRDNRWKVQKRRKLRKQEQSVRLFEKLGGTPSSGEYTPDLGIPQITELDPDLLRVVCTDRERETLTNLLQQGCFRGEALYAVESFIK